MFILLLLLTSYTFLRVRGEEGGSCMLYFVAVVALCVCVRGANLNTVTRIVTLHWNQTNHIYNNSSEKSKYSDRQMNPKNTLYFLF